MMAKILKIQRKYRIISLILFLIFSCFDIASQAVVEQSNGKNIVRGPLFVEENTSLFGTLDFTFDDAGQQTRSLVFTPTNINPTLNQLALNGRFVASEFSGDGNLLSNLNGAAVGTGINAANITTGTLPSSVLPTNLALTDANNNFTGTNSFAADTTFNANAAVNGNLNVTGNANLSGNLAITGGSINSSARITSTTGGFQMPNGATVKGMDAGLVTFGMGCPDGNIPVTFNRQFRNPPVIMITPIGNNVATTYAERVTETGFILGARSQPCVGALTAYWMALELSTADSDPRCSDGFDNDGDGLIDSNDGQCASADGNFEGTPIAFVTSGTFNGDLVTAANALPNVNGITSGIAAGNVLCQAAADAAGANNAALAGKRWIALLSDATINLNARILATTPFSNIDGSSLTSEITKFGEPPNIGPASLGSSLSRTELGTNIFQAANVWTGTDNNGGVHTGSSCNNWSSSAAADLGSVGASSDEDFWLDQPVIDPNDPSNLIPRTDTCDQAKRLYCLELANGEPAI